jgi:gluconolactonase
MRERSQAFDNLVQLRKRSMTYKRFYSLFTMSVGFLLSFQGAMAQDAPAPAVQATRAPVPEKPFQLLAITPEFWKVFAKDAKLETMATGLKFTEGPVWDRAGFVWVSDEKGNQIDKVYPDGRVEAVVSVMDPDGSTYDRDHRLWSTSSGLRSVIKLSADGKSFEVMADGYDGKKLNTPNDIVMGPDGAMYFTDPTSDFTPEQQQEQPQSIYRLGTDKTLTLLTRDLTAPNGLAFSPDGKYLYIDDDKSKDIRRYDFHKDGTISGGMSFSSLKDPVNRGSPDGMRVDNSGRIFVAGPNGFWVINNRGEHIGTVQMPHSMANLAWGGSDYSKLYIAAGNTMYILQTKTHGFIPYETKK